MNIFKIFLIVFLTIISLTILLVLGIVFSLINWNFPKASSKYYESNKYDQLCLFMAIKYDKPELCEHISPFSYDTFGFDSLPDQKIELTQSTCYDVLADNLDNPSYCDKVKPINTWFSNGSYFTAANCHKYYSLGSRSGGYGPGIDEEKELLKEMGFDYKGDVSSLSLYWSTLSGDWFPASDIIDESIRDQFSKIMDKSVKDKFIKKATDLCISH